MFNLRCFFVLASFFLSTGSHALEPANEEHFEFVQKCKWETDQFKTYKRKDSRYPEGEELACAIAEHVGEYNDPKQEDRAALKGKGLICTGETSKNTWELRPKSKFPYDTAPSITFLYFSDNGLLHFNEYRIFISGGDKTEERAKILEQKGDGGFFPFKPSLKFIEFQLNLYFSDGRSNPIYYEPITDLFELGSKTPVYRSRDRGLVTKRGWVFREAGEKNYLNRENLKLDRGYTIQCELLPKSDFQQANKLFLRKQKEIKDEFVPQATAVIEEAFEYHENKRKNQKAKNKL